MLALVTGSCAVPGLPACPSQSMAVCQCRSLSVPFSIAQPFCLNPHGSPGLNHTTWLKAWRQNIASGAASVIRAGLCVYIMCYVWQWEITLGVRSGLLESLLRVSSEVFGLGIRDFEGIAQMGNWQKSLCGGLASENMDRGCWAYRYRGEI